MNGSVFEVVSTIITYIFNVKLFDIPIHFMYALVSGVIGFCTAMILIGFPITIWEHFTKVKVREDIQNKIVGFVAICIAAFFFFGHIYDWAT